MSGEQEPWVFRGGLTADLQVSHRALEVSTRSQRTHHILISILFQRLIPVDSGNDLFVYKVPDVPTCRVFTVRPYLPADEEMVYSVCSRTCKDGLEDPHPYPDQLKNLQADRVVAPYLTLHPEFCFVVEDDAGIVGYACASPDYKKFRVKMELAWIPEMCEKYPMSLSDKDLSKFAQVSPIRVFAKGG
jgi:protein O-GlcNAcase/histone acetyltransferase